MIGVGDQVICVCDEWLPAEVARHLRCPVRGCVYTVRQILPYILKYDACPGDGFYFDELVNPSSLVVPGLVDTHEEISFFVDFFRPVKKTDIGELRKLLVPIRETERVR